jgi:endonuclease YncB( thermonuclease family)
MISKDLARFVPICFLAGASIELFMIKTGFYQIVTRKEAERRLQYAYEEESKFERMKKIQETLQADKAKRK